MGSQSVDPGFNTTSTINCSGPPPLGLTLTAAVSNTLSSALLHTRSISSELVYETNRFWVVSYGCLVRREMYSYYLDASKIHRVIGPPLYNIVAANCSLNYISMSSEVLSGEIPRDICEDVHLTSTWISM